MRYSIYKAMAHEKTGMEVGSYIRSFDANPEQTIDLACYVSPTAFCHDGDMNCSLWQSGETFVFVCEDSIWQDYR